MIKIAICDSEKASQRSLRDLIRRSCVFEEAEYSFFSAGHELIASYKDGKRFSFVFLDADMPGINGLDAGRYISEADPKAIIIFYTAGAEFAVDAFDCNAFHYIVKGTDSKRIDAILKRAYEKFIRQNRSFVVKTKQGVVNIPLYDICYVEYIKKHLIIHTEKEDYEMRDSMTGACDKLCGLGFYLCHQSFLVNFEKVHKIMKNEIVLKNGNRVMMSVRKRSETILAYNRYIERRIID